MTPALDTTETTTPGSRGGRWFVGLAFAATVLAAVLPYALKLGADRDLWWHVRTGQMILEQGALPDRDPFSFTAADAPWTNHEWLSDAVLGAIYTWGGDEGLSLWRIALLLATVTAFGAALYRRLPEPVFLVLTLLLTVPLVRIFANLRPHTYTYFFTLIVVLLFDAAIRRPRLVWVLPPLMVLWANLHGGFLLGLALAMYGLAVVWLGIEHGGSAHEPGERRRCLIVGALTLAAPAINPHGLGLFPYLVRELGADHTLILEWYGIWHFAEYRPAFVLLLVVPVGALFATWLLRPSPTEPGYPARWIPRFAVLPAAFFLVSVWGTLRHGRFLILLVLFSALLTASALAEARERLLRRRPLPILERLAEPRWVALLIGVPLLAGAAQFFVDYSRKGLRLVVNPVGLPVLATEFLQQHDLGPNLLLRLDWGGYAIWHLFPDYKVSADGRNLTVYDADFVNAQLQAYDDGRFAEYFRDYPVDTILIESAGPAYRELLANADWTRVFEDNQAAVFVQPEVARNLRARQRNDVELQSPYERLFFP